MSSAISQWLQLAAWYLSVVAFLMMLYVLLLNPRHIANRGVSALLAVIALNSLSVGLVLDPTPVYRIGLPLYVASSTATVAGIFVVTAVLIKPDWLPRGRQSGTRRLWYLVYVFSTLPIVLTLVDMIAGTRLWYTPPPGYAGGFVALGTAASGTVSAFLRPAMTYVMGSVPAVVLIYLLLRDKTLPLATRQLAWLLLAAQVIAFVIMSTLHGPVITPLAALVVSALYLVAFAYAAFRQMVSERRAQAGRVQTRLLILLLAVALPLFVGMMVVVLVRADSTIQARSDESLAAANRSVAANTTTWLDLNIAALKQLVILPSIVTMDPVQQKPVLEAMAVTHPQMYLVSTTDPQGMNVARNDAGALTDYSDRLWYREAIAGAPLTFQPLIGRTTGKPALVVSTPVRVPSGGIVGVGMFAADLADVAEQVQLSTVGEAGFSYVVDADNLVVAYPQIWPESLVEARGYSGEVSQTLPITSLGDLSAYPPVQALRAGSRGRIEFTDDAGRLWQAYVEEMEYGWGVVIQQPNDDFNSGLRGLQQVAVPFVGGGVLLLIGMTVLTVRQALMPVGRLTETATAIAGGDLERVAPVESEDEFGVLSRAFNRMTGQLRDLIGSLEQRVAERTADLERRSAYLQASAEVGRAVGSILDVDALISQVVELIRERFGLYYVGLFLTDAAGEWAVLRAGTGEAGRAMLARGHRIRVGEGMVGWSVAHREARVAQAAERDAARLATPELPETRSEAALPLHSRGRVLGALTVQHAQPDVFDPSSVAALQTMADLVAVAISNAQLLEQAQQALEAERRAYGQIGREAWAQLLSRQTGLAYRCDDQGVVPVRDGRPVLETKEAAGAAGVDLPELVLPVVSRGQALGRIEAHKAGAEEWTEQEIELMRQLGDQLGVALESARLFQDTQRRAARDRLVGEVTSRMRETLDMDAVLRTAAQEIRQVLGLSQLTVLAAQPDESSPGQRVPGRADLDADLVTKEGAENVGS